ncbi:MAG TPA: hypothetical protein VGG19_19890 [Tepidisphaeraceae bacterium]|jgi:hypothetical protein
MTGFIMIVVFCYGCHKLVSYAKQNPGRTMEWSQLIARIFRK